ncbi:MAG: hypothetical protein ACK55Z_26780, partial [bacterium]
MRVRAHGAAVTKCRTKKNRYIPITSCNKEIPRGKKKGRSFAGGLFQGHWSVDRCQKRPITVSKETYILVQGHWSVDRVSVKGAPCQKRPITVSKESY